MKTIKYFPALVLAFYFLSSGVIAKTLDPVSNPARVVEELIRPFDKTDAPGGSVMVIQQGRIIYSRVFGMANLAHEAAFTLHTPTNIGSTSKQFTALAMIILESRGMLSLQDDVRKFIPELPDLGHTVTLAHLISHTSGYREFLNTLAISGRNLNDPIRREEIIQIVQSQPTLQNIPGERWNYNNTGYALLAMVVEKVTNMGFPEWMQKNVFEPAGMNQTRVRRNPGEVIPGMAQGYAPDENGFREISDLYASMGAGGIYTSMEDLVKWSQIFYLPSHPLHMAVKRLPETFRLNDGSDTGYGFGLMADTLQGMYRLQHGGADAAHRSMFMLFPDLEAAVITQSNHAGFPNDICEKTALAFFTDSKTVMDPKAATDSNGFSYNPELFDKLAGRYALEVMPSFILEFSREQDKLYTQATGQPRFELFASSDSTFYLTVVEASVTFHRDDRGYARAITLHQNGHHRANKVEEPRWAPSEADAEMYRGLYLSRELQAFYEVAVSPTMEVSLRHRRMADLGLKAEEKDVFTGDFPVTNVRFIRNEDGVITGFMASNGRAVNILFEKQ